MMNIDDLQPGDVLLYSSTGFPGNIIRWCDDTEITHAGIYLGQNLVGEALMVGSAGINANPIHDSFAGADWIDIRRLPRRRLDRQPILDIANNYINDRNRYAYAEILLLATILLTRKANLNNTQLGLIAFWTFRKVNDWIEQIFNAGKEPMICSEFAFRCYDEADPADVDEYTLEILSQNGQQPRRSFTPRRRRRRGMTAAPPQELPTVHPDSLLADLLQNPAPRAMAQSSKVTGLTISDAELEALVNDFLQPEQPQKNLAVGAAAPPPTEADLYAETQRLLDNLSAPQRVAFGAAQKLSASERLGIVIADFVTPGDLLKTPSLETVGRVVP